MVMLFLLSKSFWLVLFVRGSCLQCYTSRLNEAPDGRLEGRDGEWARRRLTGTFARREFARRFRGTDCRGPRRYPAENVADLVEAGTSGSFPEVAGRPRAGRLNDSVAAIETVAADRLSRAALVGDMPLAWRACYGWVRSCAPAAHRGVWANSDLSACIRLPRRDSLYAACNSEKGRVAHSRDNYGGATWPPWPVPAHGREDPRFVRAVSPAPSLLRRRSARKTCQALASSSSSLLIQAAPGVQIMDDWDGFGMAATESQTGALRLGRGPRSDGLPNFIEAVQPLQYWYCLFSAIALGSPGASCHHPWPLPRPTSPRCGSATRNALMAVRVAACLPVRDLGSLESVCRDPAMQARVLRTKTFVTQEIHQALRGAVRAGRGPPLSAVGSGGAHAGRTPLQARALRPPLGWRSTCLVENFGLGRRRRLSANAERARCKESCRLVADDAASRGLRWWTSLSECRARTPCPAATTLTEAAPGGRTCRNARDDVGHVGVDHAAVTGDDHAISFVLGENGFDRVHRFAADSKLDSEQG